MYAFTTIDADFKPKDSRDPLGFQPIWAEVGRRLIKDLSNEELRYILYPQDVFCSDYPGETFRVLKDKVIRKYREYRTRRIVPEAWKG